VRPVEFTQAVAPAEFRSMVTSPRFAPAGFPKGKRFVANELPVGTTRSVAAEVTMNIPMPLVITIVGRSAAGRAVESPCQPSVKTQIASMLAFPAMMAAVVVSSPVQPMRFPPAASVRSRRGTEPGPRR
jgi:hypothetical protein